MNGKGILAADDRWHLQEEFLLLHQTYWQQTIVC